MQRLWAPWRMKYLLGEDEHAEVCIFCAFPAEGPGGFRAHQILCATDHAFVMMNKYPYSGGHLLVVPRAHLADPAELDDTAWSATTRLLQKSVAAVRAALGCDGLNVGMNLGKVAGAGIDRHCHFHVVPRWQGDTNFMPVVGEVRVVSELQSAAYERLLPQFVGLGVGPA